MGVTSVAWGEMWWVESPSLGRRPVLVLTGPQALPVLPRVLVAPAATTIRGLPSEVALDPDDGLPQACVLNLDTPELVPKALLVERIAALSDVKMAAVCAALAVATGC